MPYSLYWLIQYQDQSCYDFLQFFSYGDVLKLTEIPDASFDIALDGRCLHCIIGSDRFLFLQTAHHILRPGGILIINTMCNEVRPTPPFHNFDP